MTLSLKFSPPNCLSPELAMISNLPSLIAKIETSKVRPPRWNTKMFLYPFCLTSP